MVTQKKNKKKAKNIQHYLNLPWTYTIEITHETGEPVYVVSVNELPGVATDAPSLDKAMEEIKEAMIGTFEMYLENNEEIPEPINEDQYKGNIAYRTTSRRHFLLVKEAKKRHQSLSDVLDSLIDHNLLSTKGR